MTGSSDERVSSWKNSLLLPLANRTIICLQHYGDLSSAVLSGPLLQVVAILAFGQLTYLSLLTRIVTNVSQSLRRCQQSPTSIAVLRVCDYLHFRANIF
jgi:hypothetical protein